MMKKIEETESSSEEETQVKKAEKEFIKETIKKVEKTP